jgi:chemotaxis signal transduction protein
MKRSRAWVLDFGADLQAAVSEREMLHLLESPELYDVPATPFHCRQVVIWNRAILPVVDLVAWVNGRTNRQPASLLGIFAYQNRPGAAPQHGALILSAIPRRLSVSDDQASALPDSPRLWERVALACFETEPGIRIPIIDLAQIFSHGLFDA